MPHRKHAGPRTAFLLIVFLILFCWPAAAQDWPPILPEELALKDNPSQPGAPAMILYREVHSDDPKEFQTFYYRIKIFNDEGKKHANIVLYYWDKRYVVEEIRARTVRPDGTAVPFQGEIFDRLVARAKKVMVQAKTFTLPDVQVGSIIEYSYKIRMRNPFPDWVKEPSGYVFRYGTAWPTESWVVQADLFTRRARFSLRPLRGRVAWTTAGLRAGETVQKQPDGTFVLEAKDVVAYQEESYSPPESTLRARVDLYYTFGYIGSAEDFWSSYGRQRGEALEKFLDKKKALEREAAQLVAAGDSPETKLRKLYARVQQIRYLSYEPTRTDKEAKRENLDENKHVEDILRRGYAYGNEINMLFVGLARAAGFEAWLVAVAPRNVVFFNKNWLDPSQLSAMVVMVRSGADTLYFDPATRFCPFELLPWEESGVYGVVLSPSGGTIVTTKAEASKAAVVERLATLEIQPDGSLKGKLQIFFRGQEALNRRLETLNEDETGRRKEIEDEVKGWLPAGSTVEIEGITGWDKTGEPLRVDCNVTILNLAIPTGRRLLLPIAIFQAGRTSPFRHNIRTHPVYFRHRFQEIDDVTLQIPEGFAIENLPAPRRETAVFASSDIKSENMAGAIRVRRQFEMKGYLFPSAYYAALRSFYDRARAADDERLVLKSTADAK